MGLFSPFKASESLRRVSSGTVIGAGIRSPRGVGLLVKSFGRFFYEFADGEKLTKSDIFKVSQAI